MITTKTHERPIKRYNHRSPTTKNNCSSKIWVLPTSPFPPQKKKSASNATLKVYVCVQTKNCVYICRPLNAGNTVGSP